MSHSSNEQSANYINYQKMVLDTICQALSRDANPLVRAKAAEALGKLGDTAATRLLLQALEDQDEVVRNSVIQALSQINNGTSRSQTPSASN